MQCILLTLKHNFSLTMLALVQLEVMIAVERFFTAPAAMPPNVFVLKDFMS